MTAPDQGLGVLLSLGAATAYGASDFLGGMAGKRGDVWAVAAVSQSTAAIVAVPLAIAAFVPLGIVDAGWAILAGLGAAAGNVLIYRGLATGRMVEVAPLAAITSATVPVMVDLLGGRSLTPVLTVGVLIAIVAGWLIAGGGRGRGGGAPVQVGARGATDPGRTRGIGMIVGLLAGAGFGTQFAALGQIPADAGLTPVALSQVVSAAALVAIAARRDHRWVPRLPPSAASACAAGGLAGIATLLFQVAAQSGSLTVAAVLTSLYPAVTVALGAIVLRERATVLQMLGIALAGLAVLIVRLG